MKQSIILWIAAAVITLLSGYYHSNVSSSQPISSSFGIGLKKVSYEVDRVYSSNKPYKLLISSELPNLKGEILWRKEGSDSAWNVTPMKYVSKEMIEGYIPHQAPLTKIEYRVKLLKDTTAYYVPDNTVGTMTFLGKVPGQISFFYTFTLLLGLLLSVRTGLDYFREKDKIKMLSLFTLVTWVANVAIFNPVKITYESVAKMGMQVLPIGTLFPLNADIMLIFWIISIACVFNLKKNKLWVLISAVITLVIFQFM